MPLDYPRLSYDGAWVELRGIRSATQPQFLKKHPSLIGTHFYYLLNEELGQIDNVKLSLQTSFSNLMITNEAQMKTNKGKLHIHQKFTHRGLRTPQPLNSVKDSSSLRCMTSQSIKIIPKSHQSQKAIYMAIAVWQRALQLNLPKMWAGGSNIMNIQPSCSLHNGRKNQESHEFFTALTGDDTHLF